MPKKTAVIILLLFLFPARNNLLGKSPSGMPDRDYTFWGKAYVDGIPLTNSDSGYTISLKADNVEIASYKMGSQLPNGDNYVIKVPMIIGKVGPGKAQKGDTAVLYINGVSISDAYLEPIHQPITFPIIIGNPADTVRMDIYGKIPPGQINNLIASTGKNEGEVNLSWTAPGNNGNLGKASGYIIKYSQLPITNEIEFNNASSFMQNWLPKSPGEIENYTINGLLGGKVYYFAVKAFDNVPLYGSMSNNPVSAMAADKTPPYATGHIPAPGSSAPPDTNIYAEIRDDGIGVDQNTIKMTVEGSIISPVITPIMGGYSLYYDPPANFNYGQIVNVTLYAADIANPPNKMTIHSYSFVIVNNTPPVASNLKISPQLPKTEDNLTASYDYTDAEGSPEGNTEIKWYRNGSLRSAHNNKLVVPSNDTARGQTWYFTVRPHDGIVYGTIQTSPSVTISNSPPKASNLIITPSSPKVNDNLNGSYVYSDADGDPESGSEIKWYKDGVLQSSYNGKMTIPSDATLPAQKWYFTVSPKDGIDFGDLYTSMTVTIDNTPPVASNLLITPQNPKAGDELTSSYTYTDPEGNPEGESEIRWYKDGALQSQYNDQKIIPSATILKGQVWYFTVRPHDGFVFGETKTSPSVTVANTPPNVSDLGISPLFPTTNDDLVGNYKYTDADNDLENGSEIRWYKNKELQAIYNDKLIIPSSSTSPGQEWYFTVKPKDGTEFGIMRVSPSVSIGNTPPNAINVILTPQNPKTDDNLVGSYKYIDNEGDPEGNTEIRWYKDGGLQSSYNNLLVVPSIATSRGQTWYFTVKPHDGFGFGIIRSSNNAVIGNTFPKASELKILPASPLTENDLVGGYVYSDLDNDPEKDSEIRWYKDGVLQKAYDNKLVVPSGATSKGQTWQFTVRPKDGTDFGELQTSPIVTIGNTKPTAQELAITPALPLTNDNLVATYNYSDVDGDPESGTTIRWYKDGNLQSTYNDQKIIPSSATVKGQQWRFTVKPGDGTELGNVQTSPTVTIGNTAPVADAGGIYEGKPGEVITFNGSGSYDADNDPLSFLWDFGDNTKANTVKPAHLYEKPGVYNVSLLVNDGTVDSQVSFAKAYIGTDPSLVQQVAIDLAVGWNLISIRAQPVDDKIESLLQSIQGKYDSIWTQNTATGQWLKYLVSGPPQENSLTKLEPNVAYWIKMNKSGILVFQGTQVTGPILLKPGKNMVGYSGQNNKSIQDCVNSISGKFNYISTYEPDEGKWLWYIPESQSYLETIKFMQVGRGYIIDAKEECQWSF